MYTATIQKQNYVFVKEEPVSICLKFLRSLTATCVVKGLYYQLFIGQKYIYIKR